MIQTPNRTQSVLWALAVAAVCAAPAAAADSDDEFFASRIRFISADIDSAADGPMLFRSESQVESLPTPVGDLPTATSTNPLAYEPAPSENRYEYEMDGGYESTPVDADYSSGCSEGMLGGFDGSNFGPRAKQYPDNWMWACGGSPYRTGPGLCDDWQVGPIWDVSVDGMTLFRQETNLAAIMAATDVNSIGLPEGAPQVFDQFDFGAGGRVFLTGKLPAYAGYRLQAVYEGIEEWNASIVYPKMTDLDPDDGIDPPPGFSEQRSVHYRSSLHSGELNFITTWRTVWRPYMGIRFVRFDDELNDSINQEVAPPLPGPILTTVSATDQLNLFDLENNMIGYQIGLQRDIWKLGRRFSLQGYLNSGVYYNRVKRTNLMSLTTTQYTNDDTTTMDMFEDSTSVSTSANNDVSEQTDIAYIAEASITGVFRLNRCVALRGGWQYLWIEGVHLASDPFLGTGVDARSLVFQGWHVGVEYRR